MEYGRYYEELEVGAIYWHWPGRTLSEYDNSLFALVSMNQNPLFLDEEYTRTQGFGRRPVIDTLVFSLAVGMSVADMTGKAIANLGV
jgi:acyl dehydratase